MHNYRVVGLWAEERRLALRCSAGRYHVIRALGVMPRAGAELDGDSPHLGFGILLCPKLAVTFRMVFESIDHAKQPVEPSAPDATLYAMH